MSENENLEGLIMHNIKSLAICIVLYNLEVKDSETLNSLKRIEFGDTDVKIIIYNNGPNYIEGDISVNWFGDKVKLYQSIDNQPLSKIYNDFLNEVSADKYVILDQDSQINQKYVDDLLKLSACSIGLPKIYSDGNLIYPLIQNKSTDINSNTIGKYVSISSGLVLGSTFISKIKKMTGKEVFDQRFYLYGVDTAFFYTVNNLDLDTHYSLISGFEHSLSRHDTKRKDNDDFRLLERSYASGMLLRNYSSPLNALSSLLRLVLINVFNTLNRKRVSHSVYYFIKSYLKNEHYRSKDYK